MSDETKHPFKVIQGEKPEPRTDGLFGIDAGTYVFWRDAEIQPMTASDLRRQMHRLYWEWAGPHVIDGGKKP